MMESSQSAAPNALDMFEQPQQAQRMSMRQVSQVYYRAGKAEETFPTMAEEYSNMKQNNNSNDTSSKCGSSSSSSVNDNNK